MPTDALSKIYAKDTKTLSVGFWVNATVANEKSIGNYWGPLFNCYNEGGCASATWPQAFEVRYGGQIHGNAFGTWYDNNHDLVMESVMAWSQQNAETPDFADNWHYFTTVYTNISSSPMNFKLYIDGKLKIDEDEVLSGDANLWAQIPNLDRFCIGGNSFNWADPDNAYAYDDISFYAAELDSNQIKLIMNLKYGNIGDNERLIIARSQLESVIEEASDFNAILEENSFNTLADSFGDYLMEINPDDYATTDEVNAKIAEIQNLQNTYETLVATYKAAASKLDYYDSYIESTDYPGYSDFLAALATGREGITNQTSAADIAAAMAQVETAKIAYIFSQEGTEIDVTRIIDKPWFVNEPYEPTVTATSIIYDNETEARENLTLGNWQMPVPDELKGESDFALYLTNGRTTANLFHSSAKVGARLDLNQVITGLPAGYYEVSADMSSTSEPTNNHVYANANGFTKVSPNAVSLAFDGAMNWTTLTTDKVYVGSDGILTIGATSTTDGTMYKGWFCVTNFQIKYFGTEYDMNADLEAKKDELQALINELKWATDQHNATSLYNDIVNSTETNDYEKISGLTALGTQLNEWVSIENGFTATDNLQALSEAETNTAAKAVYDMGYNYIANFEGMSVNSVDSMNAIYDLYLLLATDTRSADVWGTDDASAAAAAVTSDLSGKEGDATAITEESAKLVAVMKATITDFEASIDNGKDITALVGNASFDNDQYAAWTIYGTFSVQQGEIEFYNNSFEFNQVITDMPKGTYKLSASGFYRDGSNYRTVVDNYWTPAGAETDSTVYDKNANMHLYVKIGGSAAISTPFVSIASDSLAIGAEDDDAYTDYYGNVNHVANFYTTNDNTADPVIYYPYWMWDAYDMITNRGFYGGNEIIFAITEDKQDITIGVEKTATVATDWAIADKFQLFYLGQELPDAIEEVSETTTKDAATAKYYTISGAQIAKPTTGIYIVKYADGTAVKKIFK